MPFVSLGATSAQQDWYPDEIDAYHAIKVTHIIVNLMNNTNVAIIHGFAIAFDEDPVPPLASGFETSQIAFYIRLGTDYAGRAFNINDVDKIVGDRISCQSENSDLRANVIIFYEIIKTSFDQYGQVSKTLKRALT